MSSIPHLVCTPVVRKPDRTSPTRLAPVDLGPALARWLADGKPFDPEAVAGEKLPVPLALAALSDPEARTYAWQGRIVFEKLYPAVINFVREISAPGQTEKFLNLATRLADLKTMRHRLQGLLPRVRRAKIATKAQYDALLFPDAIEATPAHQVDAYLREHIDAPPFAFAVATAIWAGIDERDLRSHLAANGRDEFDLEAILRDSLASFGDRARNLVVDEIILWRMIGRWLNSDHTDSQAQTMLSIDLARWNARQDISFPEIRHDRLVPITPGLDRRAATAWCKTRMNDIDREIDSATSSWKSSPATAVA